MPKLLRQLLAVYMAAEPGDTGGTGSEAGPEPIVLTDANKAELTEQGITEAEFHKLRPEDQKALIAETPDDNIPLEEEPQPRPTPAPPAATPAPTAAPAATPAPTAAPAAAADTPAASPAPTAAPAVPAVATQAAWRAMPDPLADGVVDPAPPPVIVRKEDTAKRDEVKGKLEDLFDKFADGDIKKEDYQQQKRALDSELEEINGRITAQTATNAQFRAVLSANWDAAVAKSMAMAKEQGIDYGDPANKAMGEQLDAAVRRLGQAAPLLYPNASVAWCDRWALLKAHEEVAQANGKVFTIPGTAAATPGASPAPTAAPRATPDLSKLPPTLAGAPAAADNNVQADEFAYLDKLTPSQSEREVARFDEAKMGRYLAR